MQSTSTESEKPREVVLPGSSVPAVPTQARRDRLRRVCSGMGNRNSTQPRLSAVGRVTERPFIGQSAGEEPCPIYRYDHSQPFEPTNITSCIEIRNRFCHVRNTLAARGLCFDFDIAMSIVLVFDHRCYRSIVSQ
ncbi:hypothetical protein J6590_009473 [Homalodisca vitripennis]|nr:hypothetical protein J6590_009473 [Homalodisca vitripennis]